MWNSRTGRAGLAFPVGRFFLIGFPATGCDLPDALDVEPDRVGFEKFLAFLLLFVGFMGGAFRLSSTLWSSYGDPCLRWRQMSVASPFALC